MLDLVLLINPQMTFYFLECTFRDLVNIQICVSQTKRIQPPSKPYWLENWCFLWVFLLLLRVWVLLILYHHPTIILLFTESAWQVAQLSSKTDLPSDASPYGTVTSGYLAYFFFFPPININKNYICWILNILNSLSFENLIIFLNSDNMIKIYFQVRNYLLGTVSRNEV